MVRRTGRVVRGGERKNLLDGSALVGKCNLFWSAAGGSGRAATLRGGGAKAASKSPPRAVPPTRVRTIHTRIRHTCRRGLGAADLLLPLVSLDFSSRFLFFRV